MNANVEVLNYIYQNAEMGIRSLKDLLAECEEGNFKKLLETQKGRYEEAFNHAGFLMGEVHEIPKDIPKIQGISGDVMIKLKALKDRSPSHFAEMLIQGTTMGIIQLRRTLNNYTAQEIDQKTLDLTRKLLDVEEQSVEELKKYL